LLPEAIKLMFFCMNLSTASLFSWGLRSFKGLRSLLGLLDRCETSL
jgi:hypothetical protein